MYQCVLTGTPAPDVEPRVSPRRFPDLAAEVGPDDLVFTVDLGFQYIVMNFGPGCRTDDDRVTKTYLARKNFCTYCAGVHDDSVHKV